MSERGVAGGGSRQEEKRGGVLCRARENRPFGLWDPVLLKLFVLGASGRSGEQASTAGRAGRRARERVRRALGSEACGLYSVLSCFVLRPFVYRSSACFFLNSW